MTALYLIGGFVALGLMVYLVIALLKPEIFS
jgi:K+-transporting ATPase KdpF subunit